MTTTRPLPELNATFMLHYPPAPGAVQPMARFSIVLFLRLGDRAAGDAWWCPTLRSDGGVVADGHDKRDIAALLGVPLRLERITERSRSVDGGRY